MTTLPYYLGCPVWACPAWEGKVFRAGAPRREWLRAYSQCFNTVEANSTFYAIPTTETAQRWAEETVAGFRFALKFPQAISHERELIGCNAELRLFLAVLEVLANANRLGPTFLQLPARFGPGQLASLDWFLSQLPQSFPYAVEVRHPDFFNMGSHEQALDDLLVKHQVDRVLFDSRAIFDGPPADDYEAESQRRKPRVPLRRTVTGKRPLVRFVGRNDVERSRSMLCEWAPIVAQWIGEGREPYFFTHTPNDAFAPVTARLFHESVRALIPDLPPLSASPAGVTKPSLRQRELF